MSKKGRGGRGWHTIGTARSPRHCLGCHRPVVYGDRCQDCQRRLRQRHRRKLRR